MNNNVGSAYEVEYKVSPGGGLFSATLVYQTREFGMMRLAMQ